MHDSNHFTLHFQNHLMWKTCEKVKEELRVIWRQQLIWSGKGKKNCKSFGKHWGGREGGEYPHSPLVFLVCEQHLGVSFCQSPNLTFTLSFLFSVYNSAPQHFWHQGPVSWKPVFHGPGQGGWFWDDSSTLHLLCTLFLLLPCNI